MMHPYLRPYTKVHYDVTLKLWQGAGAADFSFQDITYTAGVVDATFTATSSVGADMGLPLPDGHLFGDLYMKFAGFPESALDGSQWQVVAATDIKAEIGGFKMGVGGNLSFSIPCTKSAMLKDAYIRIEAADMLLLGFDKVNAVCHCGEPEEGILARHLLLDIKASSKKAISLKTFQVRDVHIDVQIYEDLEKKHEVLGGTSTVSAIQTSDLERLPEYMDVDALVIGTVDMSLPDGFAVPSLLQMSASLVAGVRAEFRVVHGVGIAKLDVDVTALLKIHAEGPWGYADLVGEYNMTKSTDHSVFLIGKLVWFFVGGMYIYGGWRVRGIS